MKELKILHTTITLGLEKPVELLHITDTHLVLDDAHHYRNEDNDNDDDDDILADYGHCFLCNKFLEKEIKTMPNYFADYDTIVHFISRLKGIL